MRLTRVGSAPQGGSDPTDDAGIVATGGGHAWIIRDGDVQVIDLRDT